MTPKRLLNSLKTYLKRASEDVGLPKKLKEFDATVSHVAGPETPGDAPVVVLALVRDGLPYLEGFLAHHRNLGIREFVILDNGSIDGTLEFLAHEDGVTTLASDFPFRYDNVMRTWMQQKFAANRWALVLDIDELFDFPGSYKRSLPDLLDEFDQSGVNAMLCHMLDLYPARLEKGSDAGFRHSDHRYFEVETVVDARYPRALFCKLPGIVHTKTGGVRARIFGTKSVLLSKACLYKPGPVKRDHNAHYVRNANFAGKTGVLRHYKFLPSFFDRVVIAVEQGMHYDNSAEYKVYHQLTKSASSIDMSYENSIEYQSPEQLVELGFLVDT